MSKIDKLQIHGIRSFDPHHGETIQFFSPLTLVVGFNGSGKTTIIECLKYATTGLQPPNSTGGAFIHDPKLCNEHEVLAQVKLAFKAANGTKMVATRSLSLTVKKASRTMKTLEGQLLMVKDGERTSISSRVAELDMILPQYLGVSTAVLDNVIFCHQDESLWPMSSSAILKKKFDEIFEALKYTKAIENIKALRKKQREELAKYKLVEEHAKQDKDRSFKMRTKSHQLNEEIKTTRLESDDLGVKIEQAAAAANKAWKQSEDYARILGALEGKQIEARSKRTTIKDLKQHLKETSESDERLESTLAQFQQCLDQYELQLQTKREQYIAQKDQVTESRKQLEQHLADRGKHEHDKAEYERHLGVRKDMIKKMAATHQMRGYDDLTHDSTVTEFLLKIRRMSRDQNASLERTRREAESEKREGQSLVNRLTERKAALQEGKREGKKQMAINDREAGDYQRKVDQISVDEGSSAVIESRIESVNSRIKKAQENSTRADWDKAILEANAELKDYEESSSNLNSDLIHGTKRAGETARLAHLKQELKERQRSLQTMTETHNNRITQLISEAWQPATVEQIHRNAVDEASRDTTAAVRDRDLIARELEQVQYKQKTIRGQIEKMKKDSEEAALQVRTALDGKDPAEYQERLREAQTTLEMVKDDAGNMAGMTDYFRKLLTTANHHSNPVCRSCERPFKDDKDPALVKFKARLDKLIKKAEAHVDQEEVEGAEIAYQKVLDAGVAHDKWQSMTTSEIPALTKDHDMATRQYEDILVKIEGHDKIVEKKEWIKKDLEQVSRTVASIAKCDGEIKTFESQIAELAAKQSQGGGRTLEDIQDEISILSEKIQFTKKTISRLTAEKDQSRTEISTMELELRGLQNDHNTASYQLDKKASLVTRVEEFKAMNKKQRESLDKLDKDIDKVEPEIATANAKYDDIVQRAETKERELQQQSTELSQSVNALDMANDQIKSYIDRDGLNQLSIIKREIQNLEQAITSLETEQASTTRDINNIQEQLRDSETTQRQCSDNLRYRQETYGLERVEQEIQELAAQNADVDRDRFRQESDKLTREHNLMRARQAGLMGEMRTKDLQLAEMVADYDTDLKDAPKRYREAHIRVETTKAAVEDLGRYGGALDKAIMKYHSLKMDEINRILEELWQKTYQGNDIDTILIRSDSENTKGNQSYNYRVCMVKSDVEMDMRGRCSAGQKVLACILIRIALAECFGVNCGLIALDEPTTNLDQDNIRALAESLHEIIKSREQQSNFQLIIITHDEEFLRAMRCEEFTDFYYRVSRSDKITSQIERQSIQEVM